MTHAQTPKRFAMRSAAHKNYGTQFGMITVWSRRNKACSSEPLPTPHYEIWYYSNKRGWDIDLVRKEFPTTYAQVRSIRSTAIKP